MKINMPYVNEGINGHQASTKLKRNDKWTVGRTSVLPCWLKMPKIKTKSLQCCCPWCGGESKGIGCVCKELNDTKMCSLSNKDVYVNLHIEVIMQVIESLSFQIESFGVCNSLLHVHSAATCSMVWWRTAVCPGQHAQKTLKLSLEVNSLL